MRYVRVLRRSAAALSRLRARKAALRRGVDVARGVRFGAGVRCTATDGGRIVIHRGVEIGEATSLTVGAGASLVVEDDVFISGGCTIAAAGNIRIGAESMIGELVSIRDHDHDPRYPPRLGRTVQEDVIIGPRVWLGAKSSVVRGGRIGADAVIGAHGLVNRPIDADALAVGVPARVVRRGIRDQAAGD